MESGHYISKDTNIIKMDPEWTKHCCYGIYAAKMGWDIQRDSIGRITKNPITDSDPEVRKKMHSWYAFCEYWKMYHPNLIIQRKGTVVCKKCYVFHMYSKSQYINGVRENFIEKEKKILVKLDDAKIHIKEAQSMQMIEQRHCEQARKSRQMRSTDVQNDVHTITIDFEQNLSLPWFG
eukprot:6561838-Ditylum_brightwellii.AAC.2